MAGMGARLKALWDHPAGPKTIFFWAPTFKWGITIANLSDMNRPVENVSTPQQLAISATGLIWTKYSLDINPVNYNLMTVNCFMAFSGLYQLARKASAEMNKPKCEAEPTPEPEK